MKARATIILLCLLVPASLIAANKEFMLESKCVLCHLLGESTGKGNSVIGWNKSVHARADSMCSDCHGGSETFYMELKKGHIGLPEKKRITDLCGKCHGAAKADTLGRPKGKPGEFKCAITCADCHGYHFVPKSDVSLINKTNCGSCHSFNKAESLYRTAVSAQNTFDSAEKKIEFLKKHNLPILSATRDLKKIRKDFSRAFHSQPVERTEKAIINVMAALEELDARIEESSPRQWYTQGAIILLFLFLAVFLVDRYQATVISTPGAGVGVEKEDKMAQGKSKKDDLKAHEPEVAASEVQTKDPEGPTTAKKRKSWTSRLALIIALLALALVIQEKLSTERSAIDSVNQTVTKTLMPQLKKANDRASASAIYDLKRIVVTLEQIKETSSNEGIKARINQIQADISELGVKLLVHE